MEKWGLGEENHGGRIQINCFGRLSIFYEGQEMGVIMNSAKAKELIAYLMTCKGTAVRKSAVCTALWEEATEEHGLDCLYKLLKKIRNMPIPFHIDSTKGMIQLRLDNVESDLITFQRLIQDTTDINNLKKAIHLYQASLLEEENYEWVSMKAAVYDNQYMEILNDVKNYHLDKREVKIAGYYDRLFELYA